MKDISIKDFQIGNDQDFTLMGGMNVLESEETALLVAEKFKEVTDKLKINWIFKASFDKANRSSIEYTVDTKAYRRLHKIGRGHDRASKPYREDLQHSMH